MVIRSIAVSVGVVLAAAALAGCGSESDSARLPVCGEGTTHGRFDISSYGNLYCTVLQTRDWLKDGSLATADLPRWAVTSSRGGSVEVFDFREPPESNLSGAQYTQQLLNAVHKKALLVDGADIEKLDDCLDGLTQQRIADTEGGWPRGG